MKITDNQVSAALRHVYTSAGTVLAIGTLVAVVPQDQVQPIMDALRETGDGLQHAFGGLSKLIVLVGPIVAVWMAKIAASSASFRSQLQSVFSQAATPGNVEQQKAMVVATASIPQVEKIVAPTLADAPSEKVVGQ